MAKSTKPPTGADAKPASKPRKPKPALKVVSEPAVQPAVVATPEAAVAVTLRVKDLLDRVVARSGAKKPVAKPLVEAVLAELGEALSRGESFVLPPLGRARVNRSKAAAGGEVITIKLKRGAAKKGADTPLAPEED